MAALGILKPMAKQRLFAVVHFFGKQRLISTGDLVMMDGEIPVNCGMKILLNKCLLLGGKDFSIIGKPLVDKELFRIEATVVEKTMTDHRLSFRHKPRNRGLKKYLWQAFPRTVLRINNVELLAGLPNASELIYNSK